MNVRILELSLIQTGKIAQAGHDPSHTGSGQGDDPGVLPEDPHGLLKTRICDDRIPFFPFLQQAEEFPEGAQDGVRGAVDRTQRIVHFVGDAGR